MSNNIQNNQYAPQVHPITPAEIGGLVLCSPILVLALPILLPLALYEGVRYAIKKITVFTDKEQAGRFQQIFQSSQALNYLKSEKSTLEGQQSFYVNQRYGYIKSIEQATALAAATNPLSGQQYSNLPQEIKQTLEGAQTTIDARIHHAKVAKPQYEAGLAYVNAMLAKNQTDLQNLQQRIVVKSNEIAEITKAYQQAGPLGSLKERIVAWDFTHVQNFPHTVLECVFVGLGNL